MFDDETPQDMFNRLKKFVNKGKALGSKKWTDHMLIEHMMRAYTPMNYNVVALIRQDPTYKRMSSDNVLGRIIGSSQERAIFGPYIVVEAKATVCRIQDNLKATKLCQESYTNKRRQPLQFEVGDRVYLNVSPMKGVKRFGVKEKLSPRYIGPFPILEKCGKVAYKLELPLSLSRVHDIFHVSQLKKCLKALVDVVLPEVAPLEIDLTYPAHPIKILDQKSRVTRRKMIKFYKIQWRNHTEEEATWESKDFLRSHHPDFELP
jgi:hypothetical protein